MLAILLGVLAGLVGSEELLLAGFDGASAVRAGEATVEALADGGASFTLKLNVVLDISDCVEAATA